MFIQFHILSVIYYPKNEKSEKHPTLMNPKQIMF